MRILSIALLLGTTAALFAQGSLTPPGAPAPMMKTLQQVEPRIPISGPGFVITNAGSYYLTTNITAVSGNGITIQTNDVTVDLNGFALVGPGSGTGVVVSGSRTNVTVRGGVIRGWSSGIAGNNAQAGRYEQLNVSHNELTGIYAGTYARVQGCTLFTNGLYGVQASVGLHISDCMAILNGNDGIAGYDSANIRNCTARGNGGDGITAAFSSVVVHCVTEENGGHGILVDRSLVQECTARDNIGNGIDAFLYCQIIGNHCIDNGSGTADGAGINARSFGHRIEGNNVVGNDRGIDCASTGSLIIRNSARGNGTNYDVVAGNTFGPIVTSANIATSTNPHANYSY